MNSVHTSPAAQSWTADDWPKLLGGVVLFSELSEEELRGLAKDCTTRDYARGEVVWRAGDPAEELLVVVSGELEVRGPGPHGREDVLGRIGPGECVGEMALVLNEGRSATVVTGRKAQTIVLHKDDFAALMRDDTRLLTSLTKLLSHRAMSLARRQPVSGGPLMVGVTADAGARGATLVAGAVAHLGGHILNGRSLLVTLTRESGSGAQAVDPAGVDIRFRDRPKLTPAIDITLGVEADDGAAISAIERVTKEHGRQYGLIVIDLPHLSGQASEAAETLCHRRIHLVRSASPQSELHTRVLQVVNAYGQPGLSLASNHCEPFILPIDPGLTGADADTAARFLTNRVTHVSRVLERLTRKVLGATVGVALGGGGAFGIAHVGVLSALTEAGVPIDLVAGTSMGSIIAIGYAAGLEPSRMESIASRIGNVRTALSAIDPSLSGTGLLNGRRLVSIFSPLLPKQSFEDLVLPCRVIAMDVETGERVDIGSGRLDEAFRASCSIPVIFKPVRVEGRTLVDGGMIDPVPTDVAREMGADIVIAVNVVPQLKRGVSTAISRTFKRVNRLNPLSYFSGGIRDAPDIVDVFMNSLQTTEYELGHFKSLTADVLISVDMAEFTWIDFHRAQEIIDRGREAGARSAPAARAVMEERLAGLVSS